MDDDQARLQRASMRHAEIKRFYLSRSRTEQQWHAVAADHHKFNQVWRKMLRLPANNMPPPEGCRR